MQRVRLSIIHNLSLIRWTQFDDENVFEDASRHCSIYVILKKPPTEES